MLSPRTCPIWLHLLGLACLYVGERAAHDLAQVALDRLGLALLLAALGAAVWRLRGARADRRAAYTLILQAYAVSALGLGLYAVWRFDAELVSNAANAGLDVGILSSPKVHGGLCAAGILLVLWGLLLAGAMELAALPTLQAPVFELWRLRLARRAARIAGLTLISFAALNYAANAWNRRIDLSYFKTTSVGDATAALARNISTDVVLTLFFPPGNEVLEQVRPYVEQLRQLSPHISLEVADQAADPSRAQALKVRANGALAVTANKRSEVIRLDPDLERARDSLRDLDAQVRHRLLQVLQPERVAYLTTGHMERDYAPTADDPRQGVADLKELLQNLNFSVRRLGLGEGLGSDIPADASLVLVLGPTAAFAPMERAAMYRYLQRGGRALLAMDSDHGAPDNDFLAPLGVRVGSALVAHDRYRVRIEGQREAAYDLALLHASSHPIVASLARNSGTLALVMLGSGAVFKVPQGAGLPPVEVTMALPAMPGSWEDTVVNGVFDSGRESRAPLDMAAAVVVRGGGGNSAKALPLEGDSGGGSADAGTGGGGVGSAKAAPLGAGGGGGSADAGTGDGGVGSAKAAPLDGRAVVLGDVDFACNGVLRNPGNAAFVYDIVRWLGGEEPLAEALHSELDVPIVHRKDDDAVWFYGVNFAVPAAVLAAGTLATRRASRRPRRRGP